MAIYETRISLLEQLTLPPDTLLVTIDVDSSFPSISQFECLQIIYEELFTIHHLTSLFCLYILTDSNECRFLSFNSQRYFIVGDCCKVFLTSWHAVLNCFHRFSQFHNIQTSYSTRLDTKLTKKPLSINICTTLCLTLIPISKNWLCMNEYFSGQLNFSGTALQDMTSQMTVSTLSCLETCFFQRTHYQIWP